LLDLLLRAVDRPLRVLAVGAHPDDVEIGAGGTLLELVRARPDVRVDVLVLTGTDERAEEARKSADAFLAGADHDVEVHGLADGRLPAVWHETKELLETFAASRPSPDLILGPSREDSHQDHRTLAELLPTVFREVLTLGYEIPKWDGDLVRRPMYVPLGEAVVQRKVELLLEHFSSQHGRDWYDAEVFLGLARVRGVECRSRYAEAFTCAKATLGFSIGEPDRRHGINGRSAL
jgi:LmbE family N-acetylglucosaminyl deacetylase